MDNISFQGKGDRVILLKMRNLFTFKKMPKEQAVVEKTNELAAGMTRVEAEVKEAIIPNNSDSVSAANEALSANAAKTAYKAPATRLSLKDKVNGIRAFIAEERAMKKWIAQRPNAEALHYQWKRNLSVRFLSKLIELGIIKIK